jgi:hypothetical protein
MELKVGDIVKVINNPIVPSSLLGCEGAIIRFPYSELAGIDFIDAGIHRGYFHCLDNDIETKTGYYVSTRYLEVVDQNPINKFFAKHPLA